MLDDDLFTRVALLLAATLVLMLVAVSARMRAGRASSRTRIVSAAPQQRSPVAQAPRSEAGATIPFRDATIETLSLAVFRRAFGTSNFNYVILGEHEEVLERVRRAIPEAATRRDYIPRKPRVMPRLLTALKSNPNSVRELTIIIMQDPVLTTDALRLANSPFYRSTRLPIESVDRAVALLGVDGLRSLIASSILQPVFEVPRGYFEAFSDTVWHQAQCAAFAAQMYARESREADSFAAHLLALLAHLSCIVLFRLTAASYVHASGSLPRPEVFTRLIEECAEALATRIAEDWELPEPMRKALEEHAARCAVDQMSPLGRCLYFGRICGIGAVAAREGALDAEELLQLLVRKGVPRAMAESLWRATLAQVEAGA